MSSNSSGIIINNTKYIIMGVSLLSLLFIGYFLLSSKDTSSGKGGGGPKSCTFGIDDKGNCIKPEMCGDEIKPPIDCPDDQPLICDPVLNKWRCKLTCESEDNPFPNDFSYCQTDNIKCSDGKYYCDSQYCQNGGILYSTSEGKCTCPKYFSGDKCECDSTKCKDGSIDSNCDKCLTCCDKKTSVDNRCQYYGDNCENKCNTNEVYYQDEQKCKCPLTSCYKIDDNGQCVHLQTSQCCVHGSVGEDGVCICDPNSGWSGPNCDIPICGENGKWDKNQNKCICNKDSNGNPLAAGDKCEYTREKLCSGNGIPQYSNSNRIASCKCDSKYSGDHCTCIDQPTQLEVPKCKGIYSKCKETPNSDGTYSGGWVDDFKDCNSIYADYSTEDLWKSKCTPVIHPNNPYPDYYVKCEPKIIPDKEGINNFPPVGPTCYIKNPGDDKLKNCRDENKRTGKCYISWDDTGKNQKSSTIFDKYCLCDEKDGITSYSCKPVTNEKDCGPYPPLGFCMGPDGNPVNPSCVTCGSNHIWACDQSVLPPDCIAANNNLNYHTISPNSDKFWFSDRENTPIFPTINMEKCDSVPFDTLTSDNKYQGYKSVNSAPGFVSGIGTSNQTFYSWDDDRLVNYNVNADIDLTNDNDFTNGKILINQTKKYPFPDSDISYMFDGSYKAKPGCAKFKTPFDPTNENDNTRCAVKEDGTERGTFMQYCADTNGDIVPCSDNNFHFKTDKGYCNCSKYFSKSQLKDVPYKGRYCQYSDNETCFGFGIVDNNGKCDYTKINMNTLEVVDSLNKLNDGDYIILEYLDVSIDLKDGVDGQYVLNSINNSGKYLSFYSGDLDQIKETIKYYYLSSNLSNLINPLTIDTLDTNNIIIIKFEKKLDDYKLKIAGTNNYIAFQGMVTGYTDSESILSNNINNVSVYIRNIYNELMPSYLKYNTFENPNGVDISTTFSIGYGSTNLIYNDYYNVLINDFNIFKNMWWKIKRLKK